MAAWAYGVDPEDKLMSSLRDYIKASGVGAIIDGEQWSPKTPVVLKSAEELRPAVPAMIDDKLCEWQQWRVTLDVQSDDRTGGRRSKNSLAPPAIAATKAGLRAAFRQHFYPARGEYGIFTAQLSNEPDMRDGTAFTNPYSITCETFTQIEP